MRFELKDGWTEVLFFRDEDGIHAFPKINAELVEDEGTEDAKQALHELLNMEEASR